MPDLLPETVFNERIPRFERTLQIAAHFSSLVKMPAVNRVFQHIIDNAAPAVPVAKGIFSASCRNPEPQNPFLLIHCAPGDSMGDSIERGLVRELKIVTDPNPTMIALYGPAVAELGLPGRMYLRSDIPITPVIEAAILLHEGVHLEIDTDKSLIGET